MNRRGAIGAAAMALLFFLFLFVLYRAGFIGVRGGILLVAAGVVCVWASHYFYSRLWSDDDPSSPGIANPKSES